MNFLEQLTAEWYQYTGYFVRTNIKFGRRSNGGYDGEMDVIAYNPNNSELIHIETSTDSESNSKRKEKFLRKFRNAKEHYLEIFPFKGNFKQVAIVGLSRASNLVLGEGVSVESIPQFIKKINTKLKEYSPQSQAIPESYPLLRAIQYSVHDV